MYFCNYFKGLENLDFKIGNFLEDLKFVDFCRRTLWI